MEEPQKSKKIEWKGYLLELLSVFIGVTLAFMLNKWNEEQKDKVSEIKILTEISHGLKYDLDDLNSNIEGHKKGMNACNYFRRIVNQEKVIIDSVGGYYFELLRDFISVQNSSAYETLKSTGLETITNDSLRLQIIEVYDFYYDIIEKLEENYHEMQYNKKYFHQINEMLIPYMKFDHNGRLNSLELPVTLSENDKKRFLTYLWQIETNRYLNVQYYTATKQKVEKLFENIEKEIKSLE